MGLWDLPQDGVRKPLWWHTLQEVSYGIQTTQTLVDTLDPSPWFGLCENRLGGLWTRLLLWCFPSLWCGKALLCRHSTNKQRGLKESLLEMQEKNVQIDSNTQNKIAWSSKCRIVSGYKFKATYRGQRGSLKTTKSSISPFHHNHHSKSLSHN